MNPKAKIRVDQLNEIGAELKVLLAEYERWFTPLLEKAKAEYSDDEIRELMASLNSRAACEDLSDILIQREAERNVEAMLGGADKEDTMVSMTRYLENERETLDKQFSEEETES